MNFLHGLSELSCPVQYEGQQKQFSGMFVLNILRVQINIDKK
jgi:hypothetical protein